VEIGIWLSSLGLERYEPAFRDNAIDAEVLPELTEADLEKLGVLLGHRKRMLRAIAELGTAPLRAAPAPERAERRQLTVMFCDLVGSTALAAGLDPEDLREVIGAYHRAVAEVVRSFDGFVAKYMGDGVLVYFGYPRAHEDDGERAVRAGLGIIDAVSRLDVRSVKLQARIGIATGLVVVGNVIGEGSAQEQSVVGETPNRSPRFGAAGGANWRRDRTRVFLRTAACRFSSSRGGIASRSRPPRQIRAGVPAGQAPRRGLQLQARIGAGRGAR
jgi:class 3 adenylate cyclase